MRLTTRPSMLTMMSLRPTRPEDAARVCRRVNLGVSKNQLKSAGICM